MIAIRIIAMIAAVSLALPAIQADEKKPGKLIGSYKVVRGERDGKAADELRGSVVTFTADTVSRRDWDGEEVFYATFTLDTARKPWGIRMRGLRPKLSEYADGVVEVDGDTVRVCYSLPGGEVPTAFKAGANQQCLVLKRIKPAR
jgi:uncharacterized protein (TIGR03067 family)